MIGTENTIETHTCAGLLKLFQRYADFQTILRLGKREVKHSSFLICHLPQSEGELYISD